MTNWDYFMQNCPGYCSAKPDLREEIATILESFVKDMQEWFSHSYLYDWPNFFQNFSRDERLVLFRRMEHSEGAAKEYRYLRRIY